MPYYFTVSGYFLGVGELGILRAYWIAKQDCSVLVSFAWFSLEYRGLILNFIPESASSF